MCIYFIGIHSLHTTHVVIFGKIPFPIYKREYTHKNRPSDFFFACCFFFFFLKYKAYKVNVVALVVVVLVAVEKVMGENVVHIYNIYMYNGF